MSPSNGLSTNTHIIYNINGIYVVKGDRFIQVKWSQTNRANRKRDQHTHTHKYICGYISNLKPIWKSSSLSINNKIQSDFQYKRQASQFFYTDQKLGVRVTKNISKRLQTFINSFLHSILKIRWPERITNKELWEQTKQEPIANQQICRRKWRWNGHSLRRPPLGDIARQAIARVEPKGKRRVGRQCKGDMEEIV
uniref:Uncharacterized protein n=1 Tax=Trichobilharzia regenti TaxID=157069 RepID=A0AA85KE78_TRIRE|nr:unnamed protein product [Trichobilharzia regenti]